MDKNSKLVKLLDRRMEQATEHYNQGVLAFGKQLYDRAIEQFDMALRYDPLPDFKICIYLNYAISIWLKNNFQNRDGSTISDEEYKEVKRVQSFYRDIMAIYEGLDERSIQSSELSLKQLYEQAKNDYNASVPYGLTRRNKDGSVTWRGEKSDTEKERESTGLKENREESTKEQQKEVKPVRYTWKSQEAEENAKQGIALLYLIFSGQEQDNRYEEVREKLEKSLTMEPDAQVIGLYVSLAKTYTKLASQYHKVDENKKRELASKAVAVGNKALAFNNVSKELDESQIYMVHKDLGYAHLLLREYPQAVEDFSKALTYHYSEEVQKGLEFCKGRLEEGKEKEVENQKKSGCFVATAAFGSSVAREVVMLQKFRDEVLQKSRFGRWFIEFYYDISPELANWLENTKLAKWFVRSILIFPCIKILELYRKLEQEERFNGKD